MARYGYTAIFTCLRADEAAMLRGVLESAGIEAVVEGEAAASLGLPPAVAAASFWAEVAPDLAQRREARTVRMGGKPVRLPERPPPPRPPFP